MNILVTGSSGRVGAAVSEHLARRHQVVGVDVVPGASTSVVADVLSANVVPLIIKADAIIHCAALHAPHIGQHTEQQFWDANVSTTEHLIQHSRKDANFVLSSTTSVYGDALSQPFETVWVDENLEPRPRDIYDVTKLDAEALVQKISGEHRAATVLRMSRCFPEPEQSMALYRLYRGIDLRDAVQAHTLALTRKNQYAMYIISGPTVFQRDDLPELFNDAAAVITKRSPFFGKA